jgi:hypothetical protein
MVTKWYRSSGNSAQLLIIEYGEKNKSLGKGIDREEVSDLVNKLKERLEISEIELDFSPQSLQVLDNALARYIKNLKDHPLSEDETVMFSREISAYIGEVLLSHTKSVWDTGRMLGETKLIVESNKNYNDVQKKKVSPKVIIRIGGLGAMILDLALSGNETNLYRIYLRIVEK